MAYKRAMEADALKSEAGRVDGARSLQTLAPMTEMFELKSASIGELLDNVNQGNDHNHVLEGNDEDGFIEVKETSWKSDTDNVDGRHE